MVLRSLVVWRFVSVSMASSMSDSFLFPKEGQRIIVIMVRGFGYVRDCSEDVIGLLESWLLD